MCESPIYKDSQACWNLTPISHLSVPHVKSDESQQELNSVSLTNTCIILKNILKWVNI